MQSSSLPVHRRARRTKTDVIDVEMLLRTLLAWLRGEPRVCSIPREEDEEARRAHREREDLIGERRSILNKIEGILATLGIDGYQALRRGRRSQLADLRQPDGEPIPSAARGRIERLLDRLDLVMAQIKAVERARDAVVTKKAPEDENERMIRDLVGLRGVGVESATLLVREAFCREFRNRQALGAYAGLTGTPFSSGKMEREQGIGKDGNRRVRALIVELAWFWRRFAREQTFEMVRCACGRSAGTHVEGDDRGFGP
jgi:transposase